MTRGETSAVMGMLQRNFTKFYKDQDDDFVEDAIDLWTDCFQNDPFPVVKLAVMELIKTAKFPPVIADVREKIDSLTGQASETAEEALEQVNKAVRYAGWANAEKAKTMMSPLAWRVVEAMGGWMDRCSLLNSDVGTYKAQFRNMFNTFQTREKQAAASAKAQEILRQIGESIRIAEPDNMFVTPEKLQMIRDQQNRRL